MKESKILKNMNRGAIIGLAVTAISFIIPLVPCKRESGFGICQLPNPFTNIIENAVQYYGYSNNPLTGAVFQFIFSAAIFAAIFILIKKRKKNYKDLTNK